jgi:hypothetical protein
MSRPRLQALVRGGGDHVAALSTSGPGYAVALRSIQAALPRRFDPAQARDLEATLELRVRKPGGDGFTPIALRIAGGELSVSRGPAQEAGAAAEIGADDVIRLAAGVVGWPQLISSGRMEMSGDPFLALRFPGLFRLPVG